MKKYSLQFELILKISIGFILLIIILSSSIVMFTSGQYNRIIMENIHGSMENAVNSIDYYFEDVKTPMVMLARNKNIREAMKNYTNMSNREKLNSTNAVEDFVQNITTFKSFINDIIIVGSQGFNIIFTMKMPTSSCGILILPERIIFERYRKERSGSIMWENMRRSIICIRPGMKQSIRLFCLYAVCRAESVTLSVISNLI